MNTIFIKETDVISFKDRLLLIIKRIFNIIYISDDGNIKLYILPITKNIKYSRRLIKRITRKIVQYLEKDGTNRVVLSKQLNDFDIIKNNLYSQNIHILDGRYLFKILSIKILAYILELKNTKIENNEVYICINDINDINEKIIINIAKKVKTLNVITNKMNRLKKIEKYLYEELGIVLNISNNKKTSLLNSNIILNFDFTEEILNQYRINTKAIIINMGEKINILSKKFNGINIHYYKIDMPSKYKICGFTNEEVYESIIYNYNYYKLKEKLEKDKVKINSLIGNRDKISEQEFGKTT